ncbi:MAG: triose-phosphate isomerase [Clostridia bacterium]|nr:triose-phosphate isomerase [Clostridia bacterium]
MYKGCTIKPPFFEIGPKAYLYGEEVLALAKAADELSIEFDVDIIFTPQPCDIRMIAQNTKRLHVFAQHMDSLKPGRGLGSILPEAVKAAGADGVMLNHAEKKLTLEEIKATIERADEVGLATIVCSDTVEELRAICEMHPNMIVAEPTALIGTGQASDMGYVKATLAAAAEIDPEVMVLQGAGISNGQDVYNVIAAGAVATGSTSGIIRAEDPVAAAREMIAALRKAWDEHHC